MSGILLALLSGTMMHGQQKLTGDWETLAGCRVATNAPVDEDSFHAVHDGREYIFRLYFVDAPETDTAFKDRLEAQAAYFGIAVADIPRAGKVAAGFTRKLLAGKEFTVTTRWQNAQGRSSLARYYTIVTVDGKNLAEELVAQGHARIYGLRATGPDGQRASTFNNKLKNLELTAREQKRGVWNELEFPRSDTTANVPGSAASTAPTGPINLNTAAADELQKLPGIGPKLAERIIAHRPFRTVDELDKVPGIGPATLKRLQPLVTVEAPVGSPP